MVYSPENLLHSLVMQVSLKEKLCVDMLDLKDYMMEMFLVEMVQKVT